MTKFLILALVVFFVMILRRRLEWSWKKIAIGFNLLYLLFVVWFIFPFWKEEGIVPWGFILLFALAWPFLNLVFIYNTQVLLNEVGGKPAKPLKYGLIILGFIFLIVLVALILVLIFLR